MASRARSVVLFDGVCTLCDGAVQFIIDHDPDGHFQFASLQSEAGQRLALAHGVDSKTLSTLVLIEPSGASVRSEAVLRIARRLGRPWSWIAPFSLLPVSLRDIAYRTVARYRFAWFGRRAECRIPTPDLRERFLDLSPPL